MALSIGGNKSAYKGVYINKAVIKSAVDLSGQPLQYINNSFDLAVKLTLDIGKSFDKEVTLFGNFKRDADNSVASLGAAFKVAKIFTSIGINGELTSNNEIPAEWLTQLVGREIYVLDYAIGTKEDGKTKYGTWDQVDSDKDYLLNDFLSGVKKGYPKKYVEWLDAQDNAQGDAYEGAGASVEETVGAEDLAF